MKPPPRIVLEPYRQALIPDYVDYCKTVSPRSMTIAIETATYVWFLARQLAAVNVIDLGSGFTSYLLRCYARNTATPVTVTSVDDSGEWLGKTRGFIESKGLTADGTVTWADWLDTDDRYDLAVYDFASGDLRNEGMWVIAERLALGGVVVFDDAQHDGHRAEMHAVAAKHHFELVDVHDVTVDMIGRYALAAVAP